jgi:hypothetical protein
MTIRPYHRCVSFWIAVGGPAWPRGPYGWDLTPLVAVAIALYVVRAVFLIRLTPVVVFFVFLTAPLFLLIGDSIGYPLAAILVFVTVVIAGIALRRTGMHH